MPNTNLVRSIMLLFDCFLDDFENDEYVQSLSDWEMRAQIEVFVKLFSKQWESK